ncbi:MAG: flagellin lysine-N-methylase, partial [Ruminiclostridium sp.]|nr:flagellin lysine-N-methylase [Ruminiclostridium sp.]
MKVIRFAYCSEFECMADKCPETCCKQWKVFFGHHDYLNIRNQITNSPCSEKLKSVIDSAFVKVNGNNVSEGFDYAVVKFNEKGICPLLDDDGLCMLQKELGEERLGFVCSTFPRLKTAVGNDTYIYSLNMSCPRAAELLISHKEGLRLVTESYFGGDRYLDSGLYSAPAVSEKWEGFPFYWVIKNAQIGILQNRDFSIAERMLILGYFSQKVNEYVNHGAGGNIAALAALLSDRETCGKIAQSLTPSQTDRDFAVKSMGLFAKLYLSAQSKGSLHLKELFGTVADSVGLTLEKGENGKFDTAVDYEKYLDNSDRYRRIERERPHVIENILVNLIFTQSPAEGVWKNFFITAVFYNVMMTCIPAFLGGDDDGDDGKLALAVSRAAKLTVNNGLIEKDTLLDFVDNRSYT